METVTSKKKTEWEDAGGVGKECADRRKRREDKICIGTKENGGSRMPGNAQARVWR